MRHYQSHSGFCLSLWNRCSEWPGTLPFSCLSISGRSRSADSRGNMQLWHPESTAMFVEGLLFGARYRATIPYPSRLQGASPQRIAGDGLCGTTLCYQPPSAESIVRIVIAIWQLPGGLGAGSPFPGQAASNAEKNRNVVWPFSNSPPFSMSSSR